MKVLGAKYQNLFITNPNHLSMKYLADKVVHEYVWNMLSLTTECAYTLQTLAFNFLIMKILIEIMMRRFQALREVREFVLSANMEIKIRVTGSLCGRSVSPGYST